MNPCVYLSHIRTVYDASTRSPLLKDGQNKKEGMIDLKSVAKTHRKQVPFKKQTKVSLDCKYLAKVCRNMTRCMRHRERS